MYSAYIKVYKNIMLENFVATSFVGRFCILSFDLVCVSTMKISCNKSVNCFVRFLEW
jgi:hypothetical protein